MGSQVVLLPMFIVVTILYIPDVLCDCIKHKYLDDEDCLKGKVTVNLYDRQSTHLPSHSNGLGIFMNIHNQDVGDKCNVPVDFLIKFQPLFKFWKGTCFNTPTCQKIACKRRMLQIDLDIVEITKNVDAKILFNIFEHRTQDVRADVVGRFFGFSDKHVTWFTRNRGCCNAIKAAGSFEKFFEPGVKWIRIYVAHNYFRITNNKGFDRWTCDDCLFDLLGLTPQLRFTLNGAYTRHYPGALGYGICKVHLKWVKCNCDSVFREKETSKCYH